MNEFVIIGSHGSNAEVDDPQVRQASGDHQSCQALGVGQVTFMQIKASVFLVAEEGFDLEAFFVAVPGLIRQVKVGDKINRFRVAFVPNGHDSDWAISQAKRPAIA